MRSFAVRGLMVTDSEFILSDKPHAKGADGSTFAARVLWLQSNKRIGLNGLS